MRRWGGRVLALCLLGIVLVVGGTWGYINVFRDEAPERLGSNLGGDR